MKTISKLLAVTIVLISTMGHAQEEDKKVFFDIYAGIPNGDNVISLVNDNSVEIKGSPVSFGGRVGIMIKPRISVTLDMNFVQSGFNKSYIHGYSNNETFEWIEEEVTEKYRNSKFRALGRIEYHFSKNKKIDAYVGGGLGFISERESFESTNPNTQAPNWFSFGLLSPLDAVKKSLDPVIARIDIGWRFHITDHFSFNAEVGLGGGAIIQVGPSFRF